MQETKLVALMETYTKRTWEHAHLFKQKKSRRVGKYNNPKGKKSLTHT